MTEMWFEERARTRKTARKRAKATKAYQRAMRPWYLRQPGLVLLAMIAVTITLAMLVR